MSEQLLTIEAPKVTPAIIEFNADVIIQLAKETASKYKLMVFTDETVKDAKKALAELRKKEKFVNDFKIDVKKKAMVNVDHFESECKEIKGAFAEAIEVLEKQCDKFEANRIAQKTAFVKLTIQQFYELHQIDTENQTVQIRPEWLNATAKDKDIESGIMFDIVTIKSAQDKRKSDIKHVEMLVKLANHEHGLNVELSVENYIRMLSYKSLDDVQQSISQDAQANKQKELEFAARIEREAQAKAQKEIEQVQEQAKEQVAQMVEAIEVMTAPLTYSKPVGKILKTQLIIEGSKYQLEALKEYMDMAFIKYTKVV